MTELLDVLHTAWCDYLFHSCIALHVFLQYPSCATACPWKQGARDRASRRTVNCAPIGAPHPHGHRDASAWTRQLLESRHKTPTMHRRRFTVESDGSLRKTARRLYVYAPSRGRDAVGVKRLMYSSSQERKLAELSNIDIKSIQKKHIHELYDVIYLSKLCFACF